MKSVITTNDCPIALFTTTKKIIRKNLKTICVRKVKHLLINTHLEKRKELNLSIIKLKDT
jgi:hypothetical protein